MSNISNGKHFLSFDNWSGADIKKIIDDSIKIKTFPKRYAKALDGKILTLIFWKTSTRTRTSAEAAMAQLGGHSIYISAERANFHLGALKDEVRCIDKYCDGIFARVYEHSVLDEMASVSKVPIINALSDAYHPCQTLADIMTIKEVFGRYDVRIAWLGDGNNVCNSLIQAALKVGASVAVATPRGFEPPPLIIAEAQKADGRFLLTRDPREAVKGADVVVTDTWVSMGQEAEKEKRLRIFRSYQVNKKLMAFANKKAIFMHCLPAHRGYEVTDEVMDGKQSVIFQEAENRLHTEKALFLRFLK